MTDRTLSPASAAVRQLHALTGLSLRDFAEACGYVHASSITHLEKGDRGLTIEKLCQLAGKAGYDVVITFTRKGVDDANTR